MVLSLADSIDAPAAAMPLFEGTLQRAFALAGRGLHTGRSGRVCVEPREAGHGIRFRRLDGPATTEIAATWEARVPQILCNALRFPDGRLARLVEHLMAALSAHGVDNALVTISGEELPIFDGSSLPWCEAITAAGRRVVGGPRETIRVRRTIEHRDERSHLVIEPAEALSLDVRIALAGFGPLRWRGEIAPKTFDRELAPSRSFGRLRWALPAFLYGLCTGRPVLRGALPGRTAILWGDRVVGGMTVEDEPVRHRALDLVGDLALAGRPILGHVTAINPGHDPNSALVTALMSDPDAWEPATMKTA